MTAYLPSTFCSEYSPSSSSSSALTAWRMSSFASAGTISRLKQQWQEEHKSWSKRDLERKHYVYIWADGVYFNIRSEEAKQTPQYSLFVSGKVVLTRS
jgi:transposase-like protein